MVTEFECCLAPDESHLVLPLNKFSVLDLRLDNCASFQNFLDCRSKVDPRFRDFNTFTLNLIRSAYTAGLNNALDRVAHAYLEL